MAVFGEMLKTPPEPPTQNCKKNRRNSVHKKAACETCDFISTKDYENIRYKSCA